MVDDVDLDDDAAFHVAEDDNGGVTLLKLTTLVFRASRGQMMMLLFMLLKMKMVVFRALWVMLLMMVMMLMRHQNHCHDYITSGVVNATIVNFSNVARTIISSINIMDRININRWLRATLAVAHKGELDGDARHVKPYRPQRLRHGPHQDQRYGCVRYLQRATLAVAHAGEVDEAVVDG